MSNTKIPKFQSASLGKTENVDAAQMHRTGLAYIGTTAFLWGILAIALKVSLSITDVITIVWFRFAFATLAGIGMVLRKHKIPAILSQLKALPLWAWLAGLALSANYLGFMIGVQETSPSHTQIVIQLGPLTLAIFGWLFFGERLLKRQMLGFALAGVGLSLFFREQLHNFINQADAYWRGNLWITGSALAWATYAALNKKVVKQHDPQITNVLIWGVSTLVFTPFADFSSLAAVDSFGSWAILSFLGANTLVAYGCLGEALKRLPANQISVVLTLNPILTLGSMAWLSHLGVTWIDAENLSDQAYLGALIVIAGAIAVVFRPSTRNLEPALPKAAR